MNKVFLPMGLCLAVWALAGCQTSQGAAEKAQSDRLKKVTEALHLRERPALPVLRADSPPQDVLSHALLGTPGVLAAYYDWSAAIHRIPAARTPPNPRLTLELDIKRVVMAVMPGLMAEFPGPGKLAAAGDMASAESDRAYHAFHSAVLQAVFGVRKAQWELRTLEAQIRLRRDLLAVVRQVGQLARSRQAVGQGTLQDALRAAIEEEKLATELSNMEDARAPLLARYGAALGISPGDSPPTPTRFLPDLPMNGETQARLDKALAQNPMLNRLRADIDKAQAQWVLAKKANIPDFGIGGMSDVKPGFLSAESATKLNASLSLPIWRERINADIQAAADAKDAAKRRVEEASIVLAADFAQARFMAREADRTLQTLDTKLIPLTRQMLDAARADYTSGKGDFMSLMDANRALLMRQSEREDASLARNLALAKLDVILATRPDQAPLPPSETQR